MIEVTVNGAEHQVTEGTALAELLVALDLPQTGVAVAVDAVVVTRGDWTAHRLRPGAEIEVLTAVQGG
ncbi:MAG: sulfur carrier protein ThiS [Sciscionella sp.]